MLTYERLQYFSALWGMLYFVAIFVVALVHVLRPSKRAAFDEAALIPLKDD